MYPTLPLGPLSFPTGPILALAALIVCLDVASRYGRKLDLSSDDIWNTGLIGFASGLIVARLWNVFQFWHIYSDNLRLIVSLRPSGFAFWPGVIGAIVAGYAYLIYRSLDPMRVAAALSIGGLAGGAVLSLSGYLTGSILGLASSVPWAIPYYGEPRHPVGLYQAVGLIGLTTGLWLRADPIKPGRTVLWAVLGYSLLRLFLDGFRDNALLTGQYRLSQITALAVALLCLGLLARGDSAVRQNQTGKPAETSSH